MSKKVTPYPRFYTPRHPVIEESATAVITTHPIDNQSILNITKQQGALMYEYKGVEPLFTVTGTIDACNAQDFLDYLNDIEKTNIKNILRGGNKEGLFDALVDCFYERLNEKSTEETSLEEKNYCEFMTETCSNGLMFPI